MTWWTTRREASAVASCLGAIVLTSLLWTGGSAPGFCLFHLLTTLPCPSCGLTRAFIALSHGHVHDALALNLASPLVYVATWLGLGLALIQAAVDRPVLTAAWTRMRPVLYPATLAVMASAWTVQLWHRFAS